MRRAEPPREGSLWDTRGCGPPRRDALRARGAVSLSNPRNEAPAGGAA